MSRRHDPFALYLLSLATFFAAPTSAWALGDTNATANQGVAAGGDIIGSTITVGLPPAQVEALVVAFTQQLGVAAEARTKAEARAAELATQLGFTQNTMIGFLRILGEQEVPFEQMPTKLGEIAQRYRALLTQLQTMISTDPEVQRLKEEARVALDAAYFARTEELLNQAKARDMSAIEQMRAAMEQMQTALEARQLSAAEAAAGNGALMMTQLRFSDAARYYAEAAKLTPAPEAQSHYKTLQAEALWRQGDEQGDNKALLKLNELCEAGTKGEVESQGGGSSWSCNDLLARSYRELGRRRQDLTLLSDAAQIFERSAKQCEVRDDLECSEENIINFAETLGEIGALTVDGAESRRAIAVLTEAQVRFGSLERRYLVQVNIELAEALRIYAILQYDKGLTAEASGTVRDAVDVARLAHDDALRLGEDQTMLGVNSLRKLGDCQQAAAFVLRDIDLGKAAVESYRGVLTTALRRDLPQFWGASQHQQAKALKALGWLERTADPKGEWRARYQEAKGKFEQALEVRTRERWPLEWVESRLELGSTLNEMGLWGTLDESNDAVNSMRVALQEMDAKHVQNGLIDMQEKYAGALRTDGVRLICSDAIQKGEEYLVESVSIMKTVLSGRSREQARDRWSNTNYELGMSLYVSGRYTGTEPLYQALEAYGESLLDRPRELRPALWALSTTGIAQVRWELGIQAGQPSELRKAAEALRQAREALFEAGEPDKAHGLEEGIGLLEKTIPQIQEGVRRPPAKQLPCS